MATQAVVESPVQLPDVQLTPYERGQGLPLFIQPTEPRLKTHADHFRDWYWDHAQAIDALLYEAGALVFRGFALGNTEEFDTLVANYEPLAGGYSGGSTPRGQLAERVFEATSSPPYLQIAIHQEMVYLPTYPERLAFFCRMPAVEGGETILGDMRRLTAELDRDFVSQVDSLGVLYTRNLRDRNISTGSAQFDPIHKSWQDAFFTEDPDEAVRQAEAMGLGAEWLDDASLSVTYLAPGLIDHPRTGERMWFNQIQTFNLGTHNTENYHLYEEQYGASGRFPFEATLGDGTRLTSKQAYALAETAERCAVAFPWSSGDLLLIDNYRVAHGRNTFTGLRDVQVALLA
jgi:alpha-ketoglutarate-dependent taurine dioxygenase